MSDFKKVTDIPNLNRWTHPAIVECPDCGNKKPTVQKYNYIRGAWIVRCDRCFCRSTTKMSPAEAIKAWNKKNLSYASLLFIRLKEEGLRRREHNEEAD